MKLALMLAELKQHLREVRFLLGAMLLLPYPNFQDRVLKYGLLLLLH